jgi:predicted outer membrane protein
MFKERGEERMKKFLAMFLALSMVLSLAACSSSKEDTVETEGETTAAVETVAETEAVETEAAGQENEASADVMSYAEYVAADVDTPVVVETYVQAKQSWWDDKATVYTQNEDGAFFLYNMACSAEDYDKLTVGTKIKVTGYKSEWAGEVEIIDATFEIEEGNFVATAQDVTALLGTDELIEHQNQLVSFTGMTVEAAAEGSDAAYLYSWDGSGSDGDDLYFNVSVDGQTYTFTVESYLCDSTTEVYQAVKNLQVGDVIDMEGFLYWYEGVNPHITSVTVQ